MIAPLQDRLQENFGNKGGEFFRYIVISAMNVTGHQLLLYIANSRWGWSPGIANVFAACTIAVPSYFLSRAWVWKKTDSHSWRKEVLPFWTIALAGLVVSTLFAAGAGRAFEPQWAVQVGSLIGYLIVWVAKFFLLDILFGDRSDSEVAI